MRVPFQADEARRSGQIVWLAAAGVFLAACSSAPLDDPNAQNADTPTAGSAAAPSGDGNVPSATGPTYEKQDYPAGPYGMGVNATLEDFAFLGWRDPVASDYDVNKLEQVRLSEFYNPDGRSDVKLIWINAAAVWCSVCRAEMTDVKNNQIHATFGPKGVQMIVTLFEDNNYGPAQPMDLFRWGNANVGFSIDFPLVLDPGFKMGAFFTSDATPLNMLVDARTMKVIDATMGYSQNYWQQVDKLLTRL
jgi:hypothetical protein